jgi:hypothetical protein
MKQIMTKNYDLLFVAEYAKNTKNINSQAAVFRASVDSWVLRGKLVWCLQLLDG